MKQIIIIRHAKSARDTIFCSDFERWLNKRGKHDLDFLVPLLTHEFIKPDSIVSSPAKRTKITASSFATAWWYKKKHIVRDDNIYEASKNTLCAVIEKTDESVKRLVIVWHNPWLTDLINYCWYSLDNLPTCGVVVFDYNGKYRWDFEPSQCSFVKQFFPKEIDSL